MKSQTYHIQFSNQQIYDVQAACAVDAIDRALWDNRGKTVVRCFCGELSQERGFGPGRMEFDVPHHNPIPADAHKPTSRRVDQTEIMPFMKEVAS